MITLPAHTPSISIIWSGLTLFSFDTEINFLWNHFYNWWQLIVRSKYIINVWWKWGKQSWTINLTRRLQYAINQGMFEQLKGFFISLLIASITISIGILAYWVVSCQDIVPCHASSYQASHKTINNLKMIKCFNKNIEKILYNFDIKDLMHRNVIHIWPESQVKVLWVTKHHRYRLLGEIY